MKVRTFIRNGEQGSGGAQQEGYLEVTDIQLVTGEWAEKQFPKSTPASVLAHFAEEANELSNPEMDSYGSPEEAADCFLLLCHHAHKVGYDLLDEAAKKLRKNMKRKWATEPNESGYFKHEEAGNE